MQAVRCIKGEIHNVVSGLRLTMPSSTHGSPPAFSRTTQHGGGGGSSSSSSSTNNPNASNSNSNNITDYGVIGRHATALLVQHQQYDRNSSNDLQQQQQQQQPWHQTTNREAAPAKPNTHAHNTPLLTFRMLHPHDPPAGPLMRALKDLHERLSHTGEQHRSSSSSSARARARARAGQRDGGHETRTTTSSSGSSSSRRRRRTTTTNDMHHNNRKHHDPHDTCTSSSGPGTTTAASSSAADSTATTENNATNATAKAAATTSGVIMAQKKTKAPTTIPAGRGGGGHGPHTSPSSLSTKYTTNSSVASPAQQQQQQQQQPCQASAASAAAQHSHHHHERPHISTNSDNNRRSSSGGYHGGYGSPGDFLLVDIDACVRPFLAVVVSEVANADVTLIALQSVHKFLVYGYLNAQSFSAREAVRNIARYSRKFAFGSNRRDQRDELETIHIKSLEVLLECLRCSAGDLLSDDDVYAMVAECFKVRSKKGASKLLRQYAENIAMQMVLVIFAKLSSGEIQRQGSSSSRRRSGVLANNSTWAEDQQQKGSNQYVLVRHVSTVASAATTMVSVSGDMSSYGISAMRRVMKFLADLIDPGRGGKRNDEETRVLGLRLLRIVFETAGQALGTFPPLVQVVQNDICKYLLQNTQTKNHFVLSLTLRLVFDMFSTVKEHLKVQLEVFFTSIHLRIGESVSSSFVQKELVMESLVEFCKEPSLIVGLYRNYDCEVGSTNLFEDLCTFLAHGAVPNTVNEGTTALHLLSLEGILAVLDSIAKRFCQHASRDSLSRHGNPAVALTRTIAGGARTGGAGESECEYESCSDSETEEEQLLITNPEEVARLLTSRQIKQKLRLAADRFNMQGRKAFPFLQSLKLVDDPMTASGVVRFLRNTPGLDRVKIGEFLGGSKDFNKEVLSEWTKTFDFSGAIGHDGDVSIASVIGSNASPHDVASSSERGRAAKSHQTGDSSSNLEPASPSLSLDDGLRAFLKEFVLPRESQQISRVMESFAEAYFNFSPGPLANADAAFILAFSVIMLNTDAHNDQILKKMTKEEFVRNNRQINDGSDLPYDYLSKLYDSITTNEIPFNTGDEVVATTQGEGEDGGDQYRFNAQGWQNVVKRSQTGGLFRLSAARIQGKDMFFLVWQSAVHIFIHYMEQYYDAVGQKLVENAVLNQRGVIVTSSGGVDALRDIPGASATVGFDIVAVLWSTAEGKHLQKLMDGVQHFSQICHVYDLNSVFNNLVIAICKSFCTLAEEVVAEQQANMSDPGSLFARDARLIAITQVLFKLCVQYGCVHLKEGWTNVLHCVLWLRYFGLLPESLCEMEDFTDSEGKPLESLRSGDDQYQSTTYDSVSGGDPAASAVGPPERLHRRRSSGVARRGHSDNGHRREGADNRSSGISGLFSSALDILLGGGSLRDDQSNTDEMISEDVGGGSSGDRRLTKEDLWRLAARRFVSRCGVDALFTTCAKGFTAESLTCITRALVVVSTTTGGGHAPGSMATEVFTEQLLDEEAAAFCLERFMNLAERNQHRLAGGDGDDEGSLNLWKLLYSHFDVAIRAIAYAQVPNFYTERLVVNLLSFSIRCGLDESSTSHLVQLLALFLRFGPAVQRAMSQRLGSGLLIFVQTHGEYMRSSEEWHIVFKLLFRCKQHAQAARSAFSALRFVIAHHLTFENVGALLSVLVAFAEAPARAEEWVAVQPDTVLEALYDAFLKIGDLGRIDDEVAQETLQVREQASHLAAKRQQLRLVALQCISRLCHDGRSAVRYAALDTLSKVLALSQGSDASAEAWKVCFQKILLPLLTRVSLQQYGPQGAGPAVVVVPPPAMRGGVTSEKFDIRVRTNTLIFQTLLRNLSLLQTLPDFREFWLNLVQSLEVCVRDVGRAANAARADITPSAESNESMLLIHFRESLKNVLLVMHASGVFGFAQSKKEGASNGQDVRTAAHTSGTDSSELWISTLAAISKYCPQLTRQMDAAVGRYGMSGETHLAHADTQA